MSDANNFTAFITRCKVGMAARDTGQKMAMEIGQRKKKELWQKGKMEIFQANSAKCWKNILGWASLGSPTKLDSKGRVDSSPNKLDKIMKSYFVKKVDYPTVERYKS